MRKTVIIYAISLAALAILLKLLEYRFFVRDLSLEIYVATIAVLFTAIGIWTGRKLIQTTKTSPQIVAEVAAVDFQPDESKLKEYGLSPREYKVLELMGTGCSNQEIADKLFVSLSTVKTHTTNIFFKLDVKRRTQAVIKAKEAGMIG